jgi:hypothetical protein
MAQFFSVWPAYIDKRVVGHASLIALRIRLETMAHGCDRAALAKLAATPVLGDRVRLDYANDELVVAPPAWVKLDGDATQRIRCVTGTR